MVRLLSSVVNFRNVANNTIDKISTIASGALCLPSLIGTVLTQPQKALTGVKNVVLNTAKQQLNQLAGLIKYQLTSVINQVTGRIDGVLRQVNQLVNDIKTTVAIVDDLKKTLTKRSGDILQFANDKQNCEAFAANLAKCIQTRVGMEFNRKLQKEFYSSSPTKALDEIAAKITKKIEDGDNVFEGAVNKYSSQVDKATTQLSKVNKMATNLTYSNIGQFNK
jgi:hypothetical protein